MHQPPLAAAADPAPGAPATTFVPPAAAPIPCTNCAHPLPDAARFCPACGEQRPAAQDYSIRHALHLFEVGLTDLDGKFWRSLIQLFTTPGALTRAYFEGRRTSFARPLTLFVMLNVAFFLVQPHTGLLRYELGEYVELERDARGRPTGVRIADDDRAAARVRAAIAERGDTPGEFAARFDTEMQQQKKSMLIFMIPLFALAMLGARSLTGAGAGYLYQHLVFSLHAYTFFLVVMVLVTPAFALVAAGVRAARPLLGDDAVVASLRAMNTERFLVTVLAVVFGTYLFKAVRRAYGDPAWRAVIHSALLVVVMHALIVAYRDALFFLTMWAL